MKEDLFALQVVDPEELSLRVFLILLEHTVARGSTTPSQIRRSYISIQHDDKGRKIARILGNVHRKTMQGRSADYRPLDVTAFGELEVRLVGKDKYPSITSSFTCS